MLIIDERPFPRLVASDTSNAYKLLEDLTLQVEEQFERQVPHLLTGSVGACIFLQKVSELNRGPILRRDFSWYLERLNLDVQHYEYGTTFCSGIAGLSWALDYLNCEGDKSFQGDINLILSNHLEAVKYSEYEFLYGLVGIGLCGLVSAESVGGIKVVKHVLSQLACKMKNCGSGIYWPSSAESKAHDVRFGNNQANMGLAHGNLGVTGLLLKLIEIPHFSSQCYDLLSRHLQFIRSQLNEEGNLSFFPTICNPFDNEASNKVSRVGWCYGDLSGALMIMRASQVLEDQSLYQLGLKIALSTVKRIGPEENITDAGLCHGSLGLMHIYLRLYFLTQNKEILSASQYWLDRTVNSYINSERLEQLVCSYNSEPKTNICLLDGFSGMGLALLTALHGVSPSWDECLLLS